MKLLPRLFLTGLIAHAQSQEITIDQITAAVCQVESGITWDGNQASGPWRRGQAGEISHWQITPAIVRQFGMQRLRLASDARYAAWCFGLYYHHLRMETGSDYEALAAYHRGLRGRFKKEAQDYAQRCLNLALSFANQSPTN